ncbi:hypothetical protein WT60_00830 [Burkholderia sp. MSMB617WGS]|uniref:Uncharacterized protein n=1 Tax=Burkholderia savannae TaxID=1637837 RepID=A0ABR5T9C1_9BURK|nr:hypothetical protein WT60_00830 [Burkholderia sp. MSMB617WGS]KWZ41574.1 hypothetical protein WS72_00850 [Burkholderia savannae]
MTCMKIAVATAAAVQMTEETTRKLRRHAVMPMIHAMVMIAPVTTGFTIGEKSMGFMFGSVLSERS